MKRTIKFTEYKAKAIGIMEDGKVTERELEPIVHSKFRSEVAKAKAFNSQLKENEKLVVYKETEMEKTYEVSLQDFLSIAKEITE